MIKMGIDIKPTQSPVAVLSATRNPVSTTTTATRKICSISFPLLRWYVLPDGKASPRYAAKIIEAVKQYSVHSRFPTIAPLVKKNSLIAIQEKSFSLPARRTSPPCLHRTAFDAGIGGGTEDYTNPPGAPRYSKRTLLEKTAGQWSGSLQPYRFYFPPSVPISGFCSPLGSAAFPPK